ncbi:MAG: phosphoribosylformylglycinamidine synthase subunit PurS [Candidatus Bathyarchaeia archaeon]|jgi:phosphoribosylformylglycinamidine synthase
MKYCVKIEVSLKPGHTDPEGNTTHKLLRELGYNVDSVSVSKIYNVHIESPNPREAKSKAEEMAKRLLANPTKDNYTITVEEQK